MKIRAAVLEEFGQPLVVQDVELAGPKAGEVLVRVEACGVCHTDLYTASGADPTGYAPCVLGHEGAGVVEDVGEGVTSVAPGDRVITLFAPGVRQVHPLPQPAHEPLPRDPRPAGPRLSARRHDAPLARRRAAAPLHGHLDVRRGDGDARDRARQGRPGRAARGRQHLRVRPLDRSRRRDVHGARSRPARRARSSAAGSSASARSPAAACRAPSASSRSTSRRSASRWRATTARPTRCSPATDVVEALREQTMGFGCDYTFEATGLVEVMRQAVESAREAWGLATMIGVAGKGETLEIVPRFLITGRRVTGSSFGGVKGRSQVPGLVQLWMDGKLDVDSMLSHRMPLAEVNRALRPHAPPGRHPLDPDVLTRSDPVRQRVAADRRHRAAGCRRALPAEPRRVVHGAATRKGLIALAFVAAVVQGARCGGGARIRCSSSRSRSPVGWSSTWSPRRASSRSRAWSRIATVAALRPLHVSLPALAALLGLTALNFATGPAGDAAFAMAFPVVAWSLGGSPAQPARRDRAGVAPGRRRRAGADRARAARRDRAFGVGHRRAGGGGRRRVRRAPRPGARGAALDRVDRARRARRAAAPARRACARSDDAPAPPQPGLSRIAELAAPLRAAGLEVTLRDGGRRRRCRCRRASTSRRTGSCRRRSRTRCGTRGASRAEVTIRAGSESARARDPRRRPRRRARRRERRPRDRGHARADGDARRHARRRARLPGGGFRVRARLPLGGRADEHRAWCSRTTRRSCAAASA